MDPMLGKSVGYCSSPEERHRCLAIRLGLGGSFGRGGRHEICICGMRHEIAVWTTS